MFPTTGPHAMPPMGDISDGEEDEAVGDGILMTKNEVPYCDIKHSGRVFWAWCLHHLGLLLALGVQ